MASIYSVDEEKLISLHNEGLGNRAIAVSLSVPHWFIAKELARLGLQTNGARKNSLIIHENQGLCSKCDAWKPLECFVENRPGHKLAYCNACRKQKSYDWVNSNVDVFLSDRYNRLKRRALVDGISFDLTLTNFIDIYNNQGGRCFYTGHELSVTVGRGKLPNSFSVDKIIPDRGYILGNVVFCMDRINSIKRDMTLDEMKAWTPDWYLRAERFLNDHTHYKG